MSNTLQRELINLAFGAATRKEIVISADSSEKNRENAEIMKNDA